MSPKLSYVFVFTNTLVLILIHTLTPTHTHTYANTHTHTYTHTHTHTPGYKKNLLILATEYFTNFKLPSSYLLPNSFLAGKNSESNTDFQYNECSYYKFFYSKKSKLPYETNNIHNIYLNFSEYSYFSIIVTKFNLPRVILSLFFPLMILFLL